MDRKLLKKHTFSPERLVTDDSAAVRELGIKFIDIASAALVARD
jgi:hypothetical protein